jgi:hypothetical protein
MVVQQDVRRLWQRAGDRGALRRRLPTQACVVTLLEQRDERGTGCDQARAGEDDALVLLDVGSRLIGASRNCLGEPELCVRLDRAAHAGERQHTRHGHDQEDHRGDLNCCRGAKLAPQGVSMSPGAQPCAPGDHACD